MKSQAQKLKSGLENRCRVAEMRIKLLELTEKEPVIYMWWFKSNVAAMILPQIGENVLNPRIMHDKIDGDDYMALYLGKGKSCRQRFDWHIRQRHDERTVRHGFLSTLRQTICGLLEINAVDNEDRINAFMDRNCVLDWTCFPGMDAVGLSQLEKERIANGYFPLNIQSNSCVAKEIKRALRKRRSDAKYGRFAVSCP